MKAKVRKKRAKLIKEIRCDTAVRVCQLVSDGIKEDMRLKGWKCDEDVIGGELIDIVDKNLNQIISVAHIEMCR